ncbi:MAG: hypothetical protein MZW92_71170 [Comamonadaceae bacterium]|nr:hypothetical protein [Comamonadaceae bacterium]
MPVHRAQLYNARFLALATRSSTRGVSTAPRTEPGPARLHSCRRCAGQLR